MGIEGLERVLNFLEDHNLTVDTLISDRHKQVNKWLREIHPSICHYFDIWRVAKGYCCFCLLVNLYTCFDDLMFCWCDQPLECVLQQKTQSVCLFSLTSHMVFCLVPCILLFTCCCFDSGLRKKLEAGAKKRMCSLIGDWRRSIVNHLYWCVSSTEDGDSETILAKWLSLDNHVHNEHKHASPKFVHGPLGRRK